MKKILEFVRQETVLSIALLLAVVSSCIVTPDAEYAGYIDFRTLGILFSLMAIMAGLKELHLFDVLAQKLLRSVRGFRATVCILWMLCFFSSMLITNDVALITFVPFTIILLDMMGESCKKQ